MGNMFNGCVNLETSDLSGLDLSNGGNVEYFFRYCDNLKTVIFYNSTTNLMKATNFEYMFGECHSLTSIDLSSFNVNSAKYIHHMFYDTPKLSYIDLSTFTKQAKHDDGMFEKTSENGKIKINEQIPQTIKSQIPSSWTIIY